MKKKYIKPLEELDYADLKENQEKKLREVEKQFNTEFGTDFYLMVMKRDK